MNRKYNNESIRKFSFSIFTILVGFASSINASTIELKSDEMVDVDVIIKHGDGSILPNNK